MILTRLAPPARASKILEKPRETSSFDDRWKLRNSRRTYIISLTNNSKLSRHPHGRALCARAFKILEKPRETSSFEDRWKLRNSRRTYIISLSNNSKPSRQSSRTSAARVNPTGATLEFSTGDGGASHNHVLGLRTDSDVPRQVSWFDCARDTCRWHVLHTLSGEHVHTPAQYMYGDGSHVRQQAATAMTRRWLLSARTALPCVRPW